MKIDEMVKKGSGWYTNGTTGKKYFTLNYTHFRFYFTSSIFRAKGELWKIKLISSKADVCGLFDGVRQECREDKTKISHLCVF